LLEKVKENLSEILWFCLMNPKGNNCHKLVTAERKHQQCTTISSSRELIILVLIKENIEVKTWGTNQSIVLILLKTIPPIISKADIENGLLN
jgi:hypothetical protein